MSAMFFPLLLLFPFQKPPTPAQKPDQCTLEGVVVKADTSEPLKKAVVTLRQEGGHERGSSVATDAAGRFELRTDAGRYHLSASRNGYVRQEYGEHASGGQGSLLTLSPGQKIADLSFRVLRAAVITGHVYDEDGEAVAEAEVSALRYTFWRSRRELSVVGDASTNDLGEFRIYGLAPGQYYVRASRRPDWGGSEGSPGGYLPVFYPRTTDAGAATAITLHTGEEFSGADLSLQPVHTVTIRGRVLNAVSGQPGAHASVFLLRRESDILSFGPSQHVFIQDPQGAFELRDVTPGSYYVYAHLHDGDKDYIARVPLEVSNADVDGLTLTVTQGLDIRGQVRVEGAALSNLGSVDVHLQPKNEVVMFGGMGGRDSVKPDGSFLLRNVADGDYNVYVFTLPEDFFLKSARLDGNEVLASGLTIDSQQAPKLLELVVSAQGAQIQGVVQKDQQPFSGATVVLVPDPPHRDNPRLFVETTTDQYGHFLLRGVAPGDYKLFAWENVEQGAYRSAEFLQTYEDHGHAVQVTEGARMTVQLDLIPAKDSGP